MFITMSLDSSVSDSDRSVDESSFAFSSLITLLNSAS